MGAKNSTDLYVLMDLDRTAHYRNCAVITNMHLKRQSSILVFLQGVLFGIRWLLRSGLILKQTILLWEI